MGQLVLVPLIVTALSACDNVQWGGADIEIVPPPPPAGSIPPTPDEQVYARLGMPTGSVLFHVVLEDGTARLFPVAELSGDSLRSLRRPPEVSPEAYAESFRDAVLPVGAQFQLYRRGAPVGTFVLQRPGTTTHCGLPTGVGNATVVAAAADVDEFLAFRSGLAPEVRGEYVPPQMTRSIQVYASIVAERLILRNGLPRPSSWTGAQRDLEAIEIMPGGNPEMAATYLVGDSLAVGTADPRGYSVFYLADYATDRGYTPIFSRVYDYSDPGTQKAAPRVVDYLDWDQDDRAELLIQVFGEDQSWYELIGQEDAGGEWTGLWEGGRC